MEAKKKKRISKQKGKMNNVNTENKLRFAKRKRGKG